MTSLAFITGIGRWPDTSGSMIRDTPPTKRRWMLRTRGCERRLRFIEERCATAFTWLAYAFRTGVVLWTNTQSERYVSPVMGRVGAEDTRAQTAPKAARVPAVDHPFVVAHTRDGVLALDPQGVVVAANEGAAAVLGDPAAALVGSHLDTLLAGSEVACLRDVLGGLVQGAHVTLDGRLPDRSPVRLSILRARGELADGFTCVVSRRGAAARDGQLAALAHELRSPLGVTLCWTQLLLAEDGQLNDLLRRGLCAIERSARLQHRLVEDVLDASRIGLGTMRVERAGLDLSRQCALAISAFEPKACAAGVALSALIEASLFVDADEARVQQLLQNLLDNALKFTPRGGHVSLSLAQVGAQVELVVADDGRGIEAALLPQIFDRYAQGGRDGGRASGLGLGLAIAKRISELHDGQLTAHSDGAGRGATFTWRLPRVDAPERRP